MSRTIQLMLRILISVLSIIFMAQHVVVAQNIQEESQAQDSKACAPMCFESEFIDLGTVERGEKVPFKFKFKNTSPEKIKISFIDACECSKVTYPKSYINPGSEASFDVIFDSSKKDSSEIITIYFELTTNDPKTQLPYYKELKYTYDLVSE